MSAIEYTSIEEQIEKLKSQGLILSNEEFAKNQLELYGYSNLIKSYREPYVITSDQGKMFRSDIAFKPIKFTKTSGTLQLFKKCFNS